LTLTASCGSGDLRCAPGTIAARLFCTKPLLELVDAVTDDGTPSGLKTQKTSRRFVERQLFVCRDVGDLCQRAGIAESIRADHFNRERTGA
jgi:hypothetical protein